MRLFDIDRQPNVRTWPDLLNPRRGEGHAARPRPVAHAARAVLLGAGRLFEALMVVAAGLSAPLVAGGEVPDVLVVVAVALTAAHVLASAGLYDSEAGYGRRRAVLASGLLTLLVVPPAALLASWLGGAPVPPLTAWALLAALGVAAARPAFAMALARLARWGQTARRVLVIGDRARAVEALSLIAGDERRWAFPVGICLDRNAPSKAQFGGFIAGLDEAERLVRDEEVDDVIVAVPWTDTERLGQCLSVLKPLTVDVHLFPEAPEPFIDGNGLSVLGGVPMARIATRPLSGWRAFLKAAEDRIIGSILLLLLAPLFALVAIAIKLDSPGPVFFRQSRYGYDNLPFICLKFRSMINRPEELQVRQATRDDPRVTRVGRFLRRTSLDELPQLINVVNGTMSLVGPRPHAVSHHHHYAKVVDDYRCRHRMKPGITGWAQINGYRGETATVELMRKRVVHDLWYIDHWNIWLDLAVLARTPRACLKATNAY
ncbi:MAG TPA: undecaprenyl-phosphate glucose phosphotransferase [Magnetospirillum sp.]|jgi:Undecaprenyl-phosphate glucose phosphotransferase|nr:undecaprenyl-phosphate glucose phosphotransferase [Magnetospirillum sp.]